MPLNFTAILFNPVFATLGVPALLYTPLSGVWQTITALDKTAGLDVGDRGAQIQTIKPAVKFRVAELAALDVPVAVEDLAPNGIVELNGMRYTIDSYKLDPSPNGQRDGVVLGIVVEVGPAEELDSESESESE